MKFLLTNDDGIDAAGLMALEQAMSTLGECVVVAPDQHLSGCGHQTTMHRPLALSHVSDQRHALDGTPVDCVRIGLGHAAPDSDWIISGINEGGNLGADLYRSGTVAAVREGALLGKPGIAVSQYRRRDSAADWDRACAGRRMWFDCYWRNQPKPASSGTSTCLTHFPRTSPPR